MKSQKTKQQIKDVYTFIEENAQQYIINGKTVKPMCYAIMFNKKEEVAMFPMSLSLIQTENMREVFLQELGKILIANKVKVSMFMSVTVATLYKKDDTDKQKGTTFLICSARDSLDNSKHSFYKVISKNGGYSLESDGTEMSEKDWDIRTKKKKGQYEFNDILLNSLWKGYRKLK